MAALALWYRRLLIGTATGLLYITCAVIQTSIAHLAYQRLLHTNHIPICWEIKTIIACIQCVMTVECKHWGTTCL